MRESEKSDDIVQILRRFGHSVGPLAQAADEIEYLRDVIASAYGRLAVCGTCCVSYDEVKADLGAALDRMDGEP